MCQIQAGAYIRLTTHAWTNQIFNIRRLAWSPVRPTYLVRIGLISSQTIQFRGCEHHSPGAWVEIKGHCRVNSLLITTGSTHCNLSSDILGTLPSILCGVGWSRRLISVVVSPYQSEQRGLIVRNNWIALSLDTHLAHFSRIIVTDLRVKQVVKRSQRYSFKVCIGYCCLISLG